MRRSTTVTGAVLGAGAVVALGVALLTWSPTGAPTIASPTPVAAPPSTPSPATPTPTTPAPTTPAPTTPAPTPGALALAGVVVALDPGHNRDNALHPETERTVDAGGFDKQCNTTGTASADGYPESLHTWELAQVLAAQLRAAGAVVPMTRDRHEGWGPCVDVRGRFGAQSGADLMLSLHADGSTGAGDTGFHVIRPGALPGWTDDVEDASAELASALRDALVVGGFTVSTYRGQDGIDTRTDLGTLNWADVPTVMVETHNMRNADDAAVMRSAEGQRRFAEALVAGVQDFLQDEE